MVTGSSRASRRPRRRGCAVAVLALAGAVLAAGCSAAAGANTSGGALGAARPARGPAVAPRVAATDATVAGGKAGSAGPRVAAYDGPAITGQVLDSARQCLTRTGSTTGAAACDGSAGQEWTLEHSGAIESAGRCLAGAAAPGAAAAGTGPTSAGAVLSACTGSASERWGTGSAGAVVNSGSGLRLVGPAGAGQHWTLPDAAVDPSGQAMPVGNIPGWRQVFSDDFGEHVPLGQFPAAVASRWGGYSGFKDTAGNGTYSPGQVVSIGGGVMDLYLHTARGVHLVAAPQPLIPGAAGADGGMVHGRYEARFRAQPVAGYKTAWLLWPDSNLWSDGEIDFPEGNLNSAIGAYLHHVGNPEAQDIYPTAATYGGWHTAVIQWTASAVTFTLDGKVIGQSTSRKVIPDTAMHWILQTETQLSGGAPSDSAAGHVDIDWVAVYAER